MLDKELFLFTEKAAADTEGQRRITAAVSSEAIDRDGEIITAAAMKAAFPVFMKNPVILASHQHKLPDGESSVIGKVASWSQKGKETVCVIEFADTPLGLRYWTLYKGKYQQAFFIGFRSIRTERRTIDGKSVTVHVDIELYEISAVAVPSNPEALSKAAKRRSEFVASKRAGGGTAANRISLCGDDATKSLDYLGDFYDGRLDGIPETYLKILKQIDQEVSEIPDIELKEGYGIDGFEDEFPDLSENAPGCPTNENYSKAFDGLDEGDFDESGKACGHCEPNYASLFEH
jgi:HK97 family phage prohead protease